ncbi:MAG: GSCFA domain-containing protein [Patescibacteria group bacterium]|jgi:hypothetical protein
MPDTFQNYYSNPPTLWPRDYSRKYILDAKRCLTKNSHVFGIGSCFARNVSRWLARYGVAQAIPNTVNHFNTSSIVYELSRALGARLADVEWTSVSNGLTTYTDKMRHPFVASSIDELNELRNKYTHCVQQGVRAYDIAVVTLGLSLVPREQQPDGSIQTLNRLPPSNHQQAFPFCMSFQSVSEITADLQHIVALLRFQVKAPVIFTVSPVPLHGTITNNDPRVDNMRSKSALISAVHGLMDMKIPHVYYYPAYEMFQYSYGTEMQWQGDCRHPTAGAIDKVCRSFIDEYAIEPSEFADDVEPFSVPEAP